MSEGLDIQRRIVANMTTQSWRGIPHVAFSYEPDITEYERACRASGAGVSFNTHLLHTIARALKAAPRMNAHFHYNRWLVTGRMEVKERVDISMPTILPDGRMMTLTLRDCAGETPLELQRQVDDLRRRAENSCLDDALMEAAMGDTLRALSRGRLWTASGRLLGSLLNPGCARTPRGREKREYRALPPDRRLTGRDIEQGTITVSNFGSLYRELRGRPLLLEVVPPQVTAIGVGAIQEAGGGRVLPMCVAFDHRALDFGDVVPFLKRMDALLGARPPEEGPKSR